MQTVQFLRQNKWWAQRLDKRVTEASIQATLYFSGSKAEIMKIVIDNNEQEHTWLMKKT